MSGKKYTKEQWALLSMDERLAAAGLDKADLVWCDGAWHEQPPAWYAAAGYDVTTHPYHHDLDLGWMCSNFDTSSDFPGIPSSAAWAIHKDGTDMGQLNAMFMLLMTVAVGVIVFTLVHR